MVTLRPSLIHAPQDCIKDRQPRRRGERHGRRAGALAAQRHRLERSRRPAPPCTVPGRTAVAANDSGSAALPACAGVAAGAIWSARTMTPPPATPAPTRPAPTRPAPTPDSRCCRGRTSDCRVRSRGAPTDRLGPARPPTHDARSVGAVKAYPSSVSVTVVRAVRSLADSTLLSYYVTSSHLDKAVHSPPPHCLVAPAVNESSIAT